MVREGMKVTAPVRSIADAARAGMSPEHVITAVHQALERGLATRDQFLARAQAEGGRVARLFRQAAYIAHIATGDARALLAELTLAVAELERVVSIEVGSE